MEPLETKESRDKKHPAAAAEVLAKTSIHNDDSSFSHKDGNWKSRQPAVPCDSDRADCSESEDEGLEGYKRGGYHRVKVGDVFKDKQYIVVSKLGWGHFSTVWLCWDCRNSREVALKVQKSAQHYTEAARDEIKLLEQIANGTSEKGKEATVQIYESFVHHGPNGKHVCIVFEVLGSNLLSLIKRANYDGLPLPCVRTIARNVLTGLDYLNRELKIIHTDIKPENIMMKVPLTYRKTITQEPEIRRPLSKIEDLKTSPSKLSRQQKRKLKRRLKKNQSSTPVNGDAVESSHSPECVQYAESEPSVSEGTGMDRTAVADEEQSSCRSISENEPSEKFRQEWAQSRYADILAGQNVECKIIDFGNACWTYKQFSQDIQTRQYRCPEVILGAKYSASADMWSMACVLFELATGEWLFDPSSNEHYDRDDDHLALFQELLGKIPKKIARTGKYWNKYFNQEGYLKKITDLNPWPLDRVLVEKYKWEEEEAQKFADFLLPMLDYIPSKRCTAEEALKHPWLKSS